MEMLDNLKKLFGTKDFYKIFRVDEEADDVAFKKAYRKLALEVHPDKFRHYDDFEDKYEQWATERFQVVGSVYSIFNHKGARSLFNEGGILDKRNNIQINIQQENGKGRDICLTMWMSSHGCVWNHFPAALQSIFKTQHRYSVNLQAESGRRMSMDMARRISKDIKEMEKLNLQQAHIVALGGNNLRWIREKPQDVLDMFEFLMIRNRNVQGLELIIASLIPSPESAHVDDENFKLFDKSLEKLVASFGKSNYSFMNLTWAFRIKGTCDIIKQGIIYLQSPSNAYKRFRFYEVNLGTFQIEYHGLKMQLCC